MFGMFNRQPAGQMVPYSADFARSQLRTAASPEFGKTLAGLGRTARVGGWALAGLPIAMDAYGELNKDPEDPIGNLAAAGGSVGGGLGLGLGAAALAGAVSGPAAPIVAPLAFAAGSWLGGKGGAGIARNVTNVLNPQDPLAKEIRATERMAASQRAMQMQGLQVQRAYDQLALEGYQDQANIDSAMRARQLYQMGVLGAARAPVGAYTDPAFMQSLSGLAAGALI